MSHWYAEATKPMLAQVGFGRVLDRMAKKFLPALLANVRILTFHYRQILKSLGAQVGFGRVPNRMAKKVLPALLANVRILTFHYRQILKSFWGETDYHIQISREKGSKKKNWIFVT